MMRRTLAAILAALLLAPWFAGCSERDPNATPNPGASLPDQGPEAPALLEKQPLTDGQHEFLAANINSFSAYSSGLVLSGAEGNVLYSPASAYLALSVLYECAEGQTRQELDNLLQSAQYGDQAEMAEALLGTLNYRYEEGKLQTANALFAADYIVIPDQLQQVLNQRYGIIIAQDGGLDKAQIDGWISDNTDGLIPGMDSLGEDSVVVILNSILFQNRWTDTFHENATQQEPFTLADGSELQWDLMNKRESGELEYLQTDAFTAAYLRFYYGYRIHFILPAEGLTPDDLLADPDLFFDATDYTVGNPALTYGEGVIHYKVPKLDFSGTVPLRDVLQYLGIQQAFNPEGGDFLMSTDEGNPLFVSDVRQRSLFQMDEEGAKAAAVTIVEMGEAAAAPPEEPPNPFFLEFFLDRPFLFVITAPEGYVLFTGVVNNPALSDSLDD